MTREHADELVRDLARRAEGDGERLLERVAGLDDETAVVVRARLAEIGAQVLAARSDDAAA